MLTEVTPGVQVHTSTFMLSNAVIVRGDDGVLLIDAGITRDELSSIGRDLRSPVAAGFSTHPHWDHLLWNPSFGDVPRHGTAAAAAAIGARLADPNWRDFVAGMIPADLADQVPLDDTFGRITGLPAGTAHVPWSGPEIRIIEHTAHAPGHASLLIESLGVLVAGDMLSDVLIPILSPFGPDPIGDYLVGLELLEGAASSATLVIPGHGSVGDGVELRARIDRDRAYLVALRDGTPVDDPRVGSAAKPGWEWVSELHAGQAQRFAN